MRKQTLLRYILLFTLFVAALSLTGCQPGIGGRGESVSSPTPTPSAASIPVRRAEIKSPFSVIYTSNMRGNVLPSPFAQVSRGYPPYHFSQVQEIIGRLKSGYEAPALLVDSGMFVGPESDFCRMFNGRPILSLMKDAGYAAVMADGADLDFSKLKAYDFLISDTGIPNTKKVIKAKAGDVNISIFSLYHVDDKTDPDTHPAVSLEERVKKDGGDFNILLCRVSDLKFTVKKAKGIHLVIPGRYHDFLKADNVTIIEGVPVAPFVDSRYNLGKVDVGPKEIKGRVAPAAGADPGVSKKYLKIIRPYLKKFNKTYKGRYNQVISSVVGVGDSLLKHPLKKPSESFVANLALDALRIKTGADVAIINHRAVRNNLAGVISSPAIQRAFPFDNRIVTMDLTGADIKGILSANAMGGDPFFQVSGVCLGVNKKSKKVFVVYDGGEMPDDKIYRVATINYLLTADRKGYKGVARGKNVKNTRLVLNHVVLDYVLSYPYLTPPHKRMVIGGEVDLNKAVEFYNRHEPGEVLRRLAKVMPESSAEMRFKMHLEKAVILLLQRKKEDAGEILKRLHSQDAGNVKALSLLSVLEYSRGMFEKTLSLLEGRKDAPLYALILKGLAQFRIGRVEGAAKTFRTLSKNNPDNYHLLRLADTFPGKDDKAQKPAGKPIWGTFGKNFQRTGVTDIPGPRKGEVAWKFMTHRPVQSSPAIGGDGTIYCSSGDGYLYAVKPSGVQKWKIRLGKSLVGSPTVSENGVIYQGSDDGHLYAIDTGGKVLWKYKTGGWIYSTPALGKSGRIFFGSNDMHLYALKADGKPAWRRKLPNQVFSSPTVDSRGNVLVGCLNGYVYCFSPVGNVLWDFKTKGKVYSTPAVAPDGAVVFGSDDKHVYCLTPKGKLKWKFKTGGFVPSSPAIDDEGRVYIGSEDNNFYCLDSEGGKKWVFKTKYEIFGSPAIDNKGVVYFGSDDQHVYALSRAGDLIWKVKSSKYFESSPSIGPDRRVYIGCDDGYLYCIR